MLDQQAAAGINGTGGVACRSSWSLILTSAPSWRGTGGRWRFAACLASCSGLSLSWGPLRPCCRWLVFGAYLLVDGIVGVMAAVRAAQRHERWGLLLAEGGDQHPHGPDCGPVSKRGGARVHHRNRGLGAAHRWAKTEAHLGGSPPERSAELERSSKARRIARRPCT